MGGGVGVKEAGVDMVEMIRSGIKGGGEQSLDYPRLGIEFKE